MRRRRCGASSPEHLPAVAAASALTERQQEHGGWEADAWERAAERVRGRHPEEVEALTDSLAAPAYEPLTPDEHAELAGLLEPLARAVSRELPYPNAMGLPPPC